jgi:hypothetical protein
MKFWDESSEITLFQVSRGTNCRELTGCMNITYVLVHEVATSFYLILSSLLCKYWLYFDVFM